MTGKITGGCACGKVRYTPDAAIEFSFQCHCRKCQRATGTGHSSAFALPETEVELSGDIRYFSQPSDSGAATHSGFCPGCGSPILSKTDRFPERIYLHAATLDDPSGFEPRFAVFEEMAQPWDPVDARLRNAND